MLLGNLDVALEYDFLRFARALRTVLVTVFGAVSLLSCPRAARGPLRGFQGLKLQASVRNHTLSNPNGAGVAGIEQGPKKIQRVC